MKFLYILSTLSLAGPWTTQRVLACTLDLLREIWTLPFLLGLIGLANTTVSWWRGSRAATWPRVSGVITNAHIHKGKSGSNMGPSVGVRVTIYRSKIMYTYEVGGVRFQGTRVQFGAPWRGRIKANVERTLAPYPVGKAVLVHYNPELPGDSVLEPGVPPRWRTSVVLSLVLVALGACGWLAASVTH